MAINQNLYCNKNPTQKRNCHYLVVFIIPVDRQQIMTLARHLYPGNLQHLLRHFKEALSKPYRYLLIDLKLTTPEHLRLRTDVLAPIKSNKTGGISHYLKDTPKSQMCIQPPSIVDFSEQTEARIPFKAALSSRTHLVLPSFHRSTSYILRTDRCYHTFWGHAFLWQLW